MNLTTYPDRAAWLAARRLGLGGSDVPAVLGISPWRTPLQVWSEKVGLAGDDGGSSYVLRRGTHMEPLLWRELEGEVPGLKVIPLAFQIAVGAEPWMRYSPDAFLRIEADGSYAEALGEGKSHPRGSSDWADGAPAHVVCQVQWGMHVCDLPQAFVAVDLGTEFKWQRIERDSAWIETHLPTFRAFWESVVSETPPAPTGDEGDRAVLQRLWPKPQDGRTVSLPDKVFDLSFEWDELAAQQLATKKRLDQIKAEIEAEMKDAEWGTLPDGSGFTWKVEGQDARPQPGWSKRVLRRKKAKER